MSRVRLVERYDHRRCVAIADAIVPTLLDPSGRTPIPKLHGSQLTTIVAFAVVIGILYFGRDVLIPLALSVLLSFLFAPAVRWLERRSVRVCATPLMVSCRAA